MNLSNSNQTNAALLQNMNLMTFEEVRASAHKCYHLRHPKPPVSQWLLQQRDSGHEFRLRSCGNIVIPRCADLALQILAVMCKEKFSAK